MSQSIMQDRKACIITGAVQGLHKHHIFRGVNRTAAEEYGCWCWLRADWHNLADYGVHGINGKTLDTELKQECQRRFESIHGHDKFMAVFGRSYL